MTIIVAIQEIKTKFLLLRSEEHTGCFVLYFLKKEKIQNTKNKSTHSSTNRLNRLGENL